MIWKTFTARFNNAIFLYTNHIGTLNGQLTRQCIALLYKNATLSNDSFNGAVIQWAQARITGKLENYQTSEHRGNNKD